MASGPRLAIIGARQQRGSCRFNQTLPSLRVMGTHDLRARHLWTPQGWQPDACLRIDSRHIGSIETGGTCESGSTTAQFVLPGMPNLHSHAFQRAMAGLAERKRVSFEDCSHGALGQGRQLWPSSDRDRGRTHDHDNFWTWRETMYAFASRIGPDELRAIAAQLYVEMLKAGYTHVCEFHYLHNAPDGSRYADPAAMSLALIEAATEAGIGLTLLPVLYMSGGFDGSPLSERQRRFGLSVDAYLSLLESLRSRESDMLRVGIALHSLRAVPEDAMRAVLESYLAQKCVIHIHIAEQAGEVRECLAVRGARPVQWLLDHADIDARWCLVHATHIDADETQRLAASGAVAGLCPTTEANLGDGLFPLADYLDAGGALGIGSDSHISVSVVEELRWLEYGQRLVARQRAVAARAPDVSVAETLWNAAAQGGAQAAGIKPFGIDARADLIVLDDQSPLLAARDERSVLDSFLFAGNTPLVKSVMVNGTWVARDFHHRDEERVAAHYRETVEALANV